MALVDKNPGRSGLKMKLKKVMLMAALAAAIGSVNMVTAFADETASGETKYGWESDAKNNWRYYDKDGNLASGWIKSEEGDGRGNEVWFYIDPATHIMVSNTTRNIDGVDYTFGDDGSWVAPRTTAPKGHITGGRYYNTWSNLCIPQIIGTTETKEDVGDDYIGSEYNAIGNPYRTQDLCMSTDNGDVEIYYLDMKNKPDMDAQTFVNTLVGIEKAQKGQATQAVAVTIANQQYYKASVTGKKTTNTYYCRKQDGYMVVIYTNGRIKNASALDSIVMNITTAQ